MFSLDYFRARRSQYDAASKYVFCSTGILGVVALVVSIPYGIESHSDSAMSKSIQELGSASIYLLIATGILGAVGGGLRAISRVGNSSEAEPLLLSPETSVSPVNGA